MNQSIIQEDNSLVINIAVISANIVIGTIIVAATVNTTIGNIAFLLS